MNRYKLHSKVEKVGWFLFIVMSAARDLSLVSKAHAYADMGKKKIMIGMSDESETHDRPMTADEIEATITDYVNSVKTRAQKK